MARKPRFYSDIGIYHVILRGNNRGALFHSDNDRCFFLKRLQKYSVELNIEIYAYCLMSNHIHLLIGNAGRTVSKFIQKLANSYVYYFNVKYDRTGHLFQGRFKSEAVMDDMYFKTVYRYILQNSVKAGLGDVQSYKWNSFRYIFKDENYNFINTKYILGLFDSKKQLLDYLSVLEKKECMEFKNKIIFSDEKAFKIIRKIFGINNPSKIEYIDIDDKLSKFRLLKKEGLSISQISRITGIKRSLIKSA